jgi:hypothetical protein
MAMAQAIALLSDQKLAHYMHVSPKNVSPASFWFSAMSLMRCCVKMFIAQALGTVVGCVVNYITLTQVIDTKYMYLNGSKIDPSGQVSDFLIYDESTADPQTTIAQRVPSGMVESLRYFTVLQCEPQSSIRTSLSAVLNDPRLFNDSIWGLVAPARFFAGKYTVSCLSLPWFTSAKS